jgi:hypothetical protein
MPGPDGCSTATTPGVPQACDAVATLAFPSAKSLVIPTVGLPVQSAAQGEHPVIGSSVQHAGSAKPARLKMTRALRNVGIMTHVDTGTFGSRFLTDPATTPDDRCLGGRNRIRHSPPPGNRWRNVLAAIDEWAGLVPSRLRSHYSRVQLRRALANLCLGCGIPPIRVPRQPKAAI